jgi:hypothetical protein
MRIPYLQDGHQKPFPQGYYLGVRDSYPLSSNPNNTSQVYLKSIAEIHGHLPAGISENKMIYLIVQHQESQRFFKKMPFKIFK